MTARVKVDIKAGMTLRWLRQLKPRMDRDVGTAVKRTMTALVGFMKRNGYRDQTGALSKSMRAETKRRAFLSYNGSVGAYTRYALWVDQPTRPHPIDARRVPNLVFWWARMGVWFIGPHVNHPGTKGAFFSNQTRRVGGPRLRNAIDQAIGNAIAKGGA